MGFEVAHRASFPCSLSAYAAPRKVLRILFRGGCLGVWFGGVGLVMRGQD